MRFLFGFEMVDPRTTFGLGLAVVGLVVLCASLSGIDSFPSTQPSRTDGQSPLAAIVWSDMLCDSKMSTAIGTPKLQMDDLIEHSAMFEEIEQQSGHAAACASAQELAAAVLLPKSSRVAFDIPSQAR
jgi:hypothetical protein